MFKPIKTILFATNLSETCKQAFDFAAVLATRFQATIVLLHVLEKLPMSVEGQLKGMIGEKRWNDIIASHQQDARQILIGKQSSDSLIRQALNHFCSEAGIDDASCGYQSREIVIGDGEVVEDVIRYSKEYNCDIIILGTREGFISNNVIGPTIKSIMRKSTIPVLVVPPKIDKGN
jgi:nucleotide-binding universal stress UspA family protein